MKKIASLIYSVILATLFCSCSDVLYFPIREFFNNGISVNETNPQNPENPFDTENPDFSDKPVNNPNLDEEKYPDIEDAAIKDDVKSFTTQLSINDILILQDSENEYELWKEISGYTKFFDKEENTLTVNISKESFIFTEENQKFYFGVQWPDHGKLYSIVAKDYTVQGIDFDNSINYSDNRITVFEFSPDFVKERRIYFKLYCDGQDNNLNSISHCELRIKIVVADNSGINPFMEGQLSAGGDKMLHGNFPVSEINDHMTLTLSANLSENKEIVLEGYDLAVQNLINGNDATGKIYCEYTRLNEHEIRITLILKNPQHNIVEQIKNKNIYLVFKDKDYIKNDNCMYFSKCVLTFIEYM